MTEIMEGNCCEDTAHHVGHVFIIFTIQAHTHTHELLTLKGLFSARFALPLINAGTRHWRVMI